MFMNYRQRMLMIFLSVVLLAGCAPTVSRDVLRQVDEDIAFSQLREDPQEHIDKTVLLGGQIIEVQNYPEQTVFTVLEHDLGHAHRPNPRSPSGGRFLIIASKFFDPAVYSPGRWVTVVGTVIGGETRLIQERTYEYPVIGATEIHLWPVERMVPARPRFRFGLGIGIGF